MITRELIERARGPILRFMRAGLALPSDLELLADIDAHLSERQSDAEYTPATREQEAEVDAALGLHTLPPIRLTGLYAAAVEASARREGLIVQAWVRNQIERAASPQPDDDVLRSSVPARWKTCTSAIGGVQSYIAELEQALIARGVDLDGDDLAHLSEPQTAWAGDPSTQDYASTAAQPDDRKALADEAKRMAASYADDRAYFRGDRGPAAFFKMREACFAAIDKLAAAQPVQEPATTTFVQPVPDKCDRIVWRGSSLLESQLEAAIHFAEAFTSKAQTLLDSLKESKQ